MEFSGAFHLLKNFTVGIPRPSPKDISDTDIAAAAAYLGIDVSSLVAVERIERIEAELQEQNLFLTAHLRDADIERSNFYRQSLFVREIVANNRAPKTKA